MRRRVFAYVVGPFASILLSMSSALGRESSESRVALPATVDPTPIEIERHLIVEGEISFQDVQFGWGIQDVLKPLRRFGMNRTSDTTRGIEYCGRGEIVGEETDICSYFSPLSEKLYEIRLSLVVINDAALTAQRFKTRFELLKQKYGLPSSEMYEPYGRTMIKWRFQDGIIRLMTSGQRVSSVSISYQNGTFCDINDNELNQLEKGRRTKMLEDL